MSFHIACLAVALAVPATAAAQPSSAPGAATSPYYQPSPSPAAQPAPSRVPYYQTPHDRIGWELDVGVQAGEINCSSQGGQCDDFREAGGLNAGVTYMFGPRFGVNGQVWGMAHSNDGWTVSQVISTIGIELRPVRILSLQLGVGHAHATQRWDNGNVAVSSDDAPAVMFGASLDVVRARTWALDVQLKVGTGFYGDENDDGEADIVARNIGVGVGFTWF